MAPVNAVVCAGVKYPHSLRGSGSASEAAVKNGRPENLSLAAGGSNDRMLVRGKHAKEILRMEGCVLLSTTLC